MTRTPKPEPRYADHAVYGRVQILAVLPVDRGVFVADVKCFDGTRRTILLDPRYWVSDIASLVPTGDRKRMKPRPRSVRVEGAKAGVA